MPPLSVTDVEVKYRTDGTAFSECTMSDGSLWVCDPEGKIWRKVSMSKNQLTDAFTQYAKSNK